MRKPLPSIAMPGPLPITHTSDATICGRSPPSVMTLPDGRFTLIVWRWPLFCTACTAASNEPGPDAAVDETT